MKIALVQFHRENNFVYYFLSEHIRLFYHAFLDLGLDVVIDTRPHRDRVNVLFSLMQAVTSEKNYDWSQYDYVVYQPEILSQKGVNNLPDLLSPLESQQILKTYLRVLAQARMVWEVFPFNVEFLAGYGIRSNLLLQIVQVF